MGRRSGEPLVRLAEVEVVSVCRERLEDITPNDVAREGFGTLPPEEFVRFFCEHMRCAPTTEITRIQWRYVDHPDDTERGHAETCTRHLAEIDA